MPDKKMVMDFEDDIKKHLAAIKESGTMRPNTTAIYELSKIYNELTGDPICLTCSGYLAQVYKYFLNKARYF